MENHETEDERFAAERLASLQPPAGWEPDGSRAFVRLREFDRSMQKRRRAWICIAAASAAALALLVIAVPRAYCAGKSCAQEPIGRFWQKALRPSPAQTSLPAAEPDGAAPSPAFKIEGSPSAALTCEIYSDYECPHCAVAYRDLIPRLMTDYVRTGKVRLLHRDLPLPQHLYSRLAARYANAAGRVGEYDVAVAQIFRTQAAWSANGDVAAQLAGLLPPNKMQKIRDLVANDQTLDDSIIADLDMARQDQIRMTPSLVVVKNAHREVLAPIPTYELLKAYLDGLLGPR